MKRTPLQRKTRLKRKPWRKALGSAEQRLRFKQAVLEADGGRCVLFSRGTDTCRAGDGSFRTIHCDGPLQAAHVIPKQRLRRMGYGADVIYDPASSFTLCLGHHELHDSYALRVPLELWPARCIDFFRKYGRSEVA